MKKSIVFITVVVLIAALNFFWVERKYAPDQSVHRVEKESKITYVKLSGQTIKVDLAVTFEAQLQGLSGRESLADGEGMLFIFPNSGEYLFWMKDMNFPIDIIWIGADGRVVSIKESALPDSFPEVFKPDNPAKYVLEVLAGFSEKNNLAIGDGVEFTF